MLKYKEGMSESHCLFGFRALVMMRDQYLMKTDWELDEWARPAIIALNKLPGVATTWSCQGYHDGETSRLYYVMIADEDGKSLLRDIYKEIFHRLNDVFNKEIPEEGLREEAWYLRYEEGFLNDYINNVWYEMVCFEAGEYFSTELHYKLANEMIATVVEERLKDLPPVELMDVFEAMNEYPESHKEKYRKS